MQKNSIYSILPSKTEILKSNTIELRYTNADYSKYKSNIDKILDNLIIGKYSLDEYSKIQNSLSNFNYIMIENTNNILGLILDKPNKELEEIVEKVISTSELRIKDKDYCVTDMLFILKDIYSVLDNCIRNKISWDIREENIDLLIEDKELFQLCVENVKEEFAKKTHKLRELNIEIINKYIEELVTKIPKYVKNMLSIKKQRITQIHEVNKNYDINTMKINSIQKTLKRKK